MTYYVFSDVDETLIKCKSMLSFMTHFLFVVKHNDKKFILKKQEEFSKFMTSAKAHKNSRLTLNLQFYAIFKGFLPSLIQLTALNWVKAQINAGNFFIEEILQEHKEHKKNGAKLILVSGSFREILAPIQNYIGADHLLCTELEIQNGLYTGKLLKQVIGDGKWQSIQEYSVEKNVTLSSCFAYGDHQSDICFMEKVGNPVAVVGNGVEMQTIAQQKGWRIIQLNANKYEEM